jgi:transcription-repair coupling factor (superfamily II helicase)
MYRRVAAVQSETELGEVRLELIDRFGPIPEEVEHLLALIALRIRAQALGIESMIEHEREIVIRPVETRPIEPLLISGLGGAVRVTAHSIRIRLLDLTIPWQDAIDLTLRAIESTRRVHAVDEHAAVAAAG